MSEDEFVTELEPEDVQEIINWAVSSGALIILLHNAPEYSTNEEMVARLGASEQAVEIMFHNMPECMIPSSEVIAEQVIDEVEEDEQVVQAFIEELKDL